MIRVLLVEDEIVQALKTERALDTLGYIRMATVPSLSLALQAVDELAGSITVVVTGIRLLSGVLAYPLIDKLNERKIPVVIATGFGKEDIDANYHHVPYVRKPFEPQELYAAITLALASND